MYLSLVFLPLLGSIASGFFGFILGGHGAAIISTGLLGLTFICSLTAFYEVALCGNTCFVNFLPMDLSAKPLEWYYDNGVAILMETQLSLSEDIPKTQSQCFQSIVQNAPKRRKAQKK